MAAVREAIDYGEETRDAYRAAIAKIYANLTFKVGGADIESITFREDYLNFHWNFTFSRGSNNVIASPSTQFASRYRTVDGCAWRQCWNEKFPTHDTQNALSAALWALAERFTVKRFTVNAY